MAQFSVDADEMIWSHSPAFTFSMTYDLLEYLICLLTWQMQMHVS